MTKSIFTVYESTWVNPAINSFIIEIKGFIEKKFQGYPRFCSCTQLKLNSESTKCYPKECKALCNISFFYLDPKLTITTALRKYSLYTRIKQTEASENLNVLEYN